MKFYKFKKRDWMYLPCRALGEFKEQKVVPPAGTQADFKEGTTNTGRSKAALARHPLSVFQQSEQGHETCKIGMAGPLFA